jgi:hypothetical protein
MRMLTVNEMTAVSGGESPCYALKGNSDCNPPDPAPSAKDIGDWADAMSLSLQAYAVKNPKQSKLVAIPILGLEATSIIAGWFEDAESNPPHGGQTHNTPPTPPGG